MSKIELPEPTAWITVVETSQGPSSQVNWTKMRGVKHHPLYTADQVHACARAALERAAQICDEINSESGGGWETFGEAIRAEMGNDVQDEERK